MTRRRMGILFFALLGSQATAEPVAPPPFKVVLESRYQAPSGHVLLDPAFSPDGSEIVLSQKYGWPEPADEPLPSELARLEQRKQKEPRFADPEIIVVKSGRVEERRIGWGWNPTFTSDGRKIIYAAQTRPGVEWAPDAAALDGNAIELYDRAAKKSETLAVPATGYLSAPTASPDGKEVYFLLSGATNGAWGGGIGIDRINLNSKQRTAIITPQKSFGFPHLIGPMRWIHGHLVCFREIPTAAGHSEFMAGSYEDSLIDISSSSRVLFTGAFNQGGFLFMPGFKDSVLIDQLPRDIPLEAGPQGDESGFAHLAGHISISPDGRNYAQVRGDSLFVGAYNNQSDSRVALGTGDFKELRWSSDSKKILAVFHATKDEKGKPMYRDELRVFRLIPTDQKGGR